MSGTVKIATRICAKLLDLTFCGYGLVFDVLFFKLLRDITRFYLRHYRMQCEEFGRRLMQRFSTDKEGEHAFG